MAKSVSENVKLKNVRISFAHLYTPQEGRIDKETGKKGDPSFNCNFLFAKNTPEGKAIFAQVKEVVERLKKEKFGKNIPKFKADKVCMRDGDQENYDGYEDMFYISAGNKKQPTLIDRVKVKNPKTGVMEWAESPDGQIYSGCYVNAVINVWIQDNDYGQRINASLEVVQFRSAGEAFGGTRVDANEAFDEDDVGEEDDDDLGGSSTDDEDEDDGSSLL